MDPVTTDFFLQELKKDPIYSTTGRIPHISHIPKFDPEKANERFKQLEKEFEAHLKQHRFVPLWNPHTEDIVPELSSVRRTRKTRRKFRVGRGLLGIG